MSQPGIQRHFNASPRPEPDDPDPEVISECRSSEEIRAERAATGARITTLWQLPDRLKKKRGAPTYDSKWLAGLHDLVTAISLDQTREPSAEYILEHCPPEFRAVGFQSHWVVAYFRDLKCLFPSWIEFPSPTGEGAAVEGAAPDEPVPLAAGDRVCLTHDIPERCWVDGCWQTSLVAQVGDAAVVQQLYQKECLQRVQVLSDKGRPNDTLLIHVCHVNSQIMDEQPAVAVDNAVRDDAVVGAAAEQPKAAAKRKHYSLAEIRFFQTL